MKRAFALTTLFVSLIIVATFPLIFRITTCIPGFVSTDESFGALWDSWRIKHAFLNNLSFGHNFFTAYPFGTQPYSGGYFSILWMFWLYLLNLLTNPPLAYNIQVILNLFLSSLFTYLLVSFVSGNRLSGIIGGIIFAFCPYEFARIWQHLGLSYNQWLVFTIFAALILRKYISIKNSILFLLTLLLLFSFDFSVMYFGTVMILCLFVHILSINTYKKILKGESFLLSDYRYLKRSTFVVMIACILILPQFIPIIKNILHFRPSAPSAFNLYHRPFEDLFAQSARPLSYFLPATVHPVFGKFTENFIGTELYGDSFTEHTLYLGWTALILAFVAFRKWRRSRRLQVADKENFHIGFFVFLAVAAWLFSQPPWWNIFGFKLYMPSFFMYKILPMFRAYCRFGIVVMLAVAVLAGFGLKFFLERFKSQKIKSVVTALFCGLVLFEFWNWPPYKVIDLSKVPSVYYWLKEQPKDIVIAEYPLDYDSPNELYKFFQTVHEKKIVNGTIPGTYANKVAQEIRRLSAPKTASILKWMGVKYVIVHKDDYLKTDLIEDREDMGKIAQNPGLKFVKSFPPQECPDPKLMCVQKTGPIEVYEVVANPIDPKIEE